MTTYNNYIIGPDVLKPQYSGEYAVQAIYDGHIANFTFPSQAGATNRLAGANSDTLEIVLCEVPAGVKPIGLMWAFSKSIASSNLTAAFKLRKKASNAILNNSGNAGYFGDANTVSGSATPDVTIGLNGTSLAINGNVNGSCVLIPGAVEGLSPAKPTLQESYYLSILFTSATGNVDIPTDATIYAGVEGVFLGNL